MSSIRNHRAALAQASHNDSASVLVFLEIVGLGALVGWLGGDWVSGVVAAIILMVLLMIPYIRVLVSLVLSVAWAAIAGVVVKEVFEQSENAALAAAIVAGLLSLAAHFGFLEWSKDMDANDEVENPNPGSGVVSGLAPEAAMANASDIECPVCAEWIKAKATKCRFCGHPMTPQPSAPPPAL